jgi:hypothetical protein
MFPLSFLISIQLDLYVFATARKHGCRIENKQYIHQYFLISTDSYYFYHFIFLSYIIFLSVFHFFYCILVCCHLPCFFVTFLHSKHFMNFAKFVPAIIIPRVRLSVCVLFPVIWDTSFLFA